MLVLGKNLFILGFYFKVASKGGEYYRIKKLWYSDIVRVNFYLLIRNRQQCYICNHSKIYFSTRRLTSIRYNSCILYSVVWRRIFVRRKAQAKGLVNRRINWLNL